MNKQLDKMFNAVVRVDTIIHLGSMIACTESVAPLVIDTSDDDEGFLKAIGIPVDIEGGFQEVSDEELIEHCINKKMFGFAVKFASPVHKRAYGEVGLAWSWGHYHTKWFYGDSFEELLDLGTEWAYNHQRQAELL